MSASIPMNTTSITFDNEEGRKICALLPSNKVFLFLALMMDNGDVTVNSLAECGAQKIYYADECMD